MRFKLDENLGQRWVAIFTELGHEAETVIQEGMGGSPDETIFGACVREQRCLVSLDLDFADVTRFPPAGTAGIAVLRLTRGKPSVVLEWLMKNLLAALKTGPIAGRLWIIEPGRVRIHESVSEE